MLILTLFHHFCAGDFCRRQAKAAPPNSERRQCLEYIEMRPASGISGIDRTENLTQVKFPTFSGIRFFAVRRATLVKGKNQSSPRVPFLKPNEDQKSKIDFSASAERRYFHFSLNGLPSSHKRKPCANGTDHEVSIKRLVQISAHFNSKLKISTLTQKCRLGGISRCKQYIPITQPKRAGKRYPEGPKIQFFAPGLSKNKQAHT
ncbi:hypothetical protein R3P38DRAFT_2806750 [Favolaschia claudopus]|uniref:Uncharacterized protein n=1 Tax=Favolaschia claudopus TaxID=2862362 RepID=A0AAV9ZIQ5_9AGAR